MSQSYVVEPAHPGGGRAHARFRVTIPVDCSTQHLFISNHVSNISKGGLFIRSDEPLPLNAEVALVLRLPETAGSIRATGRVVWNFDMPKGTSQIVAGSGIRFLDMAPRDRAALEAYLDRLATASSSQRTPTS